MTEDCLLQGVGKELNRLCTNVPGASAVFLGSYVTYANEAKIQALGVRAETLERHGAVSEPIAREMAEGARQNLRADFGIGITGIAGPAGGTEAKPVGTVFIALAEVSGTKILRQLNCFDRETFNYVTTQQALSLLLRSFREL